MAKFRALSAAVVPAIANTETANGSSAATRLPKIHTNARNVTGNAMTSMTMRSSRDCRFPAS
ncbi:Uncharacterised protein [Mycobacteroides abscessus subsp. abscessus]|nr:Uncharacterised protein [Mycobacteroides abscessus subsp. abscessus]